MFRKRNPHAGACPGTLVFENRPCEAEIRIVRYSPGGLTELRDATVEDIRIPANRGEQVWIDISGTEDPEVIRVLAERFRLSPLTVEAIVNVPQRPTAEVLEGSNFLILHALELLSDGKLRSDQLSLLLGPNYVVTLHSKDAQYLEAVRNRLRRQDSRLRQNGSDYLAYAVADLVVDGYYPVLEWFGEELERLEDEALENPQPELLRAIHALRTELIRARRSSWPMREALESMSSDEASLISKKTAVFMRDTVSHCAQIVDVIEMYRESAGALVSTYMSSLSHRSNEIMKVLTMMSSVFVPLTFIAGIYGMNFKNMPELQYDWSYPIALGVMISTAALMLLYFRRLGWFGPSTLATKKTPGGAVEPEQHHTVVLEDTHQIRNAA